MTLIFHSEEELQDYLRTMPEDISVTITVETEEAGDGEEENEG